MHDTTGDHLAGFYIAGTLVLISGLSLLLLPLIEHFQPRRENNLQQIYKAALNKANIQSGLIGSIGGVHLAQLWQLGSPPPEMTIDKPLELNMESMSTQL